MRTWKGAGGTAGSWRLHTLGLGQGAHLAGMLRSITAQWKGTVPHYKRGNNRLEMEVTPGASQRVQHRQH